LDSLVEPRIIVDGRTEIEAKLSSIWQEVLELDRVSIYDNFFDLGGHSLSGMRVLARMRRDFHIDIPIRSLFDKPTIAELALELEEHKANGAAMRIAGIVPGAPASAMLDVLRAELSKLSSEEVDGLLQSIRAEGNSTVGDRGKS